MTNIYNQYYQVLFDMLYANFVKVIGMRKVYSDSIQSLLHP